jgi:hypothetical protein
MKKLGLRTFSQTKQGRVEETGKSQEIDKKVV